MLGVSEGGGLGGGSTKLSACTRMLSSEKLGFSILSVAWRGSGSIRRNTNGDEEREQETTAETRESTHERLSGS
jgi:hypothetical protein